MVSNKTLSLIDSCEEIAGRLIKASPAMKDGLLTGKSGCCIFLYELGKYTNNDQYGNKADELLAQLCQSIDPRQGLTFSDGLFGIGWALDIMQERGFIEVNEAQIMKYIDNLAAGTRFFNYSLPFGFLGQGTYLLRRENKWRPNDNECFDLYNKLFIVCDELNYLLDIHMKTAGRYHTFEIPRYVNTVSAGSLIYFLDEIATSIFLFQRMLKKKKYTAIVRNYLEQFAIACKMLLETFLSSTASILSLDKDPEGVAAKMVIFKLYAALQNMESAIDQPQVTINWDQLKYVLDFTLTTLDFTTLGSKHTFFVIQMLQLLNRMKRNQNITEKAEQLRVDLLDHCNKITLQENNNLVSITGLAGWSGIGLCLLANLTELDAGYNEAWGI